MKLKIKIGPKGLFVSVCRAAFKIVEAISQAGIDQITWNYQKELMDNISSPYLLSPMHKFYIFKVFFKALFTISCKDQIEKKYNIISFYSTEFLQIFREAYRHNTRKS